MKKLNAEKGLALVMVIMIVFSAIAGGLGTDWGKINVEEVTYITDSGKTLSGHLYVPKTATAETPAPGIVTIHGYTRTSESHGVIALELARRGFVIFNIDMYGHGESENGTCGTGEELVDALQYMDALDFVDSDKLGATGHSNGGRCIEYMPYWTEEERAANEVPEIKAILFAGWDPAYKNKETKEWQNKYGNIDVAMVAATYDDFFYGTSGPSRDFMKRDEAKAFVTCGKPESFEGSEVESGKYYYTNVDGKETLRTITMISGIHVCEVFFPKSIAAHCDFFDAALGAPNMFDSGNQIGQLKEFCTLVSYAAIPFFLTLLALCLLKTKAFACLNAKKTPVQAEVPDKEGLLWFWGTVVFVAAVSFFTYKYATAHLLTDRYNYQVPMLGLWALFGGIGTAIALVAFYFGYAKKKGISYKNSGIRISAKNLGMTVVLTLCVIFALYFFLCAIYNVFGVDFRFWFLGFKPMQTDRIFYALRWSLLYMTYYIMNSISINCFKYNKVGGEKGNVFLMGLSNILCCLVIFIIHYGNALINGYTFWFGSNSYRVGVGWLFSTVLFLFSSAIVSRVLYKKTANPYLGGMINAVIITMLGVCQTMIGFPI